MAEAGKFAGKTILITGAGSGIGKATALYLAKHGASLSLCDISATNLDTVADEITNSFPETTVFTQTVDVTKPDDVQKWVEASKEKFGQFQGCVNCAGLTSKHHLIADIDIEEWNTVIGVNLTGTFNSLKYESIHVADGGSIVNIASIFGLYGSAYAAPYVASKHAVIGLTKSAAIENAARGVRVNAVCPAWVKTPMIMDYAKDLQARGVEFQQTYPNQLFKRIMDPEEVTSVIVFLLGDESKFITKAAYEISGGYAS
ncbi:hypothetical protein JX266_004756 [Neoarthrinium moseri]|nr:hypothetical protein JX266_004756 [Neoarthrinium moseri]